MRCSRTNAATSKVYTLFSYCILRNGRVRAFCSFSNNTPIITAILEKTSPKIPKKAPMSPAAKQFLKEESNTTPFFFEGEECIILFSYFLIDKIIVFVADTSIYCFI